MALAARASRLRQTQQHLARCLAAQAGAPVDLKATFAYCSNLIRQDFDRACSMP